MENGEEKPSILVVDDDVMNLQIAEKMLADGFRVYTMDSGEKALDFLKSQIPELVLLDIHMPGMNGFTVLEKMRADRVYREIPVIFLTADDDRDTEVRGFQAGALDFITKPFVADIMLQRVNRILQLDRLQKNLQQEVEKQTKVAEERRRKVERLARAGYERLGSDNRCERRIYEWAFGAGGGIRQKDRNAHRQK